jgi:hypothetical protein
LYTPAGDFAIARLNKVKMMQLDMAKLLSRRIPCYLIAGCFFVLAGCAANTNTSGSAGGHGPDRFAQADTNHDGRLDPNEVSDYFVNTIFPSRDLNHDGRLTWKEWHVPGASQSKARFESADTDKDGSLRLPEALAFGRKRGVFKQEFEEADANRDGYVTREEAQAYSASIEGPPR